MRPGKMTRAVCLDHATLHVQIEADHMYFSSGNMHSHSTHRLTHAEIIALIDTVLCTYSFNRSLRCVRGLNCFTRGH